MDITIRVASVEDAPKLLEIYAYYVEHTAITYEFEVPTLADFEQRIANTLQNYPTSVIGTSRTTQLYCRTSSESKWIQPRWPSMQKPCV
jgi:phosphinothricin acetyltransferase